MLLIFLSLKDKKGVSIVNAFQNILNKSKIWVNKGGEFYNRSMKSWLEKNDVEMYSTHNEGKSFVVERFIRRIRTNIYKHVTSISENVYIDKLDDTVNEYNNTKHRTAKMKPIDVKNNTYIDFCKEVNDNDLKFKVGDHVRISKYKNIFAKGYTPIGLKKFLLLKKTKKQFHGHMSLMILMVKKLLEHFMKKNCKR